MADNFQRTGSISNAHVGREFELKIMNALRQNNIIVERNFSIEVGIEKTFKQHNFDLGSNSPPILVECKSHTWTKGNNIPSAKMAQWNEAMYYFKCAPGSFRKMFVVLLDKRISSGETLAAYYIHTYPHLIPSDVEIWEFDEPHQQLHSRHGL